MTTNQIKAKAKTWKAQIDKISKEHQQIEEELNEQGYADDHEYFIAVGFALGALEQELEQLQDNG